ncbi:hypothetical protein V6N13_126156 [Hibiscus sabdariffa]
MSGSQGTQSSQSSSPCKVNDPTSNKIARKKQQPRATCWNHFSKFVTKGGENRARCIHIDNTYSVETEGSTTNLNNHLKTCLKKPQDNIVDLKQSELAFAKLYHLPSRYTIRRDCLDLFNSMKRSKKNSFGKDTSKICLTTDTWTSLQRVSYMVLTAHWIDDEWMLQKRIINFCLIYAHRGESISQALEKYIRDWGIKRFFTITVDNTSSNSVGIEYLKKKLNHRNVCVANRKYVHTRCVAHIINLIVQECVKYASISVG